MGELIKKNGAVNQTVEYLGKANGKWLAVPAAPGSQMKPPCSRIDLMKQHAGIDVQAMYPAGSAPKADNWTWDTFLAGRTADKLLADTLAEWDAWRKPPVSGLSPEELKIWRQSEAVLRMGQIRESWQDSPRRKNHGMVLASLPPGGWHTGWVRDATYALTAMARTGHTDVAEFATAALHNTGVSFCTRRHFGRPQPGETEQYIRLAYSGIDSADITEGLGALAHWVGAH